MSPVLSSFLISEHCLSEKFCWSCEVVVRLSFSCSLWLHIGIITINRLISLTDIHYIRLYSTKLHSEHCSNWFRFFFLSNVGNSLSLSLSFFTSFYFTSWWPQYLTWLHPRWSLQYFSIFIGCASFKCILIFIYVIFSLLWQHRITSTQWLCYGSWWVFISHRDSSEQYKVHHCHTSLTRYRLYDSCI